MQSKNIDGSSSKNSIAKPFPISPNPYLPSNQNYHKTRAFVNDNQAAWPAKNETSSASKKWGWSIFGSKQNEPNAKAANNINNAGFLSNMYKATTNSLSHAANAVSGAFNLQMNFDELSLDVVQGHPTEASQVAANKAHDIDGQAALSAEELKSTDDQTDHSSQLVQTANAITQTVSERDFCPASQSTAVEEDEHAYESYVAHFFTLVEAANAVENRSREENEGKGHIPLQEIAHSAATVSVDESAKVDAKDENCGAQTSVADEKLLEPGEIAADEEGHAGCKSANDLNKAGFFSRMYTATASSLSKTAQALKSPFDLQIDFEAVSLDVVEGLPAQASQVTENKAHDIGVDDESSAELLKSKDELTGDHANKLVESATTINQAVSGFDFCKAGPSKADAEIDTSSDDENAYENYVAHFFTLVEGANALENRGEQTGLEGEKIEEDRADVKSANSLNKPGFFSRMYTATAGSLTKTAQALKSPFDLQIDFEAVSLDVVEGLCVEARNHEADNTDAIHETVTSLAEGQQTYLGVAQKTATDAAQAVASAVKSTYEFGVEVIDNTTEAVFDTAEAIVCVANTTFDVSHRAVVAAKDAVVTAANEAYQFGAQAIEDVKETVIATANAVVEVANSTFEKSQQVLADIKNSAVETANSAYQFGVELIGEAKQAVVETADVVLGIADIAFQTSKILIGAGQEPVVNAVNRACEFGVDLMEDTIEAVVDTAQMVVEVANGVLHTSQALIAAATEPAVNALNGAYEFGAEAIHNAREVLLSTANIIAEIASNTFAAAQVTYTAAKDNVVEIAKQGYAFGAQVIEKTTQAVIDTAQVVVEVANAVLQVGVDIAIEAKNFVVANAPVVIEAGKKLVEDVVGVLNNRAPAEVVAPPVIEPEAEPVVVLPVAAPAVGIRPPLPAIDAPAIDELPKVGDDAGQIELPKTVAPPRTPMTAAAHTQRVKKIGFFGRIASVFKRLSSGVVHFFTHTIFGGVKSLAKRAFDGLASFVNYLRFLARIGRS